jgi:carbon-monoxide dehydrogenase large subunit
MPGVRLVLTGAKNSVRCPALLTFRTYSILAREELRHVGEAIAFMVAETLAKDAAEAITASWEGLPPVMRCRGGQARRAASLATLGGC